MANTDGASLRVHHLGNLDLLKLPKTAFLCSRKAPGAAILRCFDWALEQRESGCCVISGFHSPLERDVLCILLRGTQPLIVVLARGMKQYTEPELNEPLTQGHLLILTPFPDAAKRVTTHTATQRNAFMLSLADTIVVGHATPNGLLAAALAQTTKPMRHLTQTGCTKP